MTPETLDLFRAVVDADATAVRRALLAGADINATDGKGRNIVSHAALGEAIDAIDAPIQPRLSDHRLEILQLVLEHKQLSLYSLNAPLPWAGGVTLLGLMSWLNMPTEIMFLLEYTQGLVEVNAMDDQGATPLMYATRDGSLEVVQRLLAHGARPDLRDTSKRSAIQYALPHPQVLWLCEDAVRRERASEQPVCPSLRVIFAHLEFLDFARQRSGNPPPNSTGSSAESIQIHSSTSTRRNQDLFLATSMDTFLKPPSSVHFDSADLRHTFEMLLRATRAGDDVTLHALLFPAQLENSRTTSLINLRDSSGLSLVHHAVSQRRRVDGAVLDALYRAGADVGLFSTLGFSPLHHLARTAREPSAAVQEDPPETYGLYKFTLHLLRDLRAPLGATDPKGETPLHSAAEHGQSRLVLQAMLHYDSIFAGAKSVRESRNERGLRPVEVCRPEFLSIFAQESPQTDAQLRPQNSWDSTGSRERIMAPHASTARMGMPSSGRPQSVNRPQSARPRSAGRPPTSTHGLLTTKASDGSLQSLSSGSSSTSSGARSFPSRPSTQFRKPGTPLHTHTLPSPSPTGTSLSEFPDAHSSFDIQAYTRDLLSNLSLCASALHAYSQSQQGIYETDYTDLPDLPALSEAIMFTREIGSLMLEHWTKRLGIARVEFERARSEVEQVQGLSEKANKQVGLRLGLDTDNEAKPSEQNDNRSNSGAGAGTDVRHAVMQTDASAVYVAHLEIMTKLEQETAYRSQRLSLFARQEEEQFKEPATPERAANMLHLINERRAEETRLRDAQDEVRLNRWYVESASFGTAIGVPLLLGWVKSGSLPPLEIVMETQAADESMVGREARRRESITTVSASASTSDTFQASTLLEDTVQNAPRVLERVQMDICGVVTLLSQVTEVFIYAQQSLAQASALVEQALKAREARLQELAGIQLDMPHPPSSFRTPRKPQRPIGPPSDSSPLPPPAQQQLSPSDSSSNLDRRYIASSPLIEDPQDLRRLLTRKIDKHIERVFHELQKARTWLRIIREVLRGLRRRAASADH